MAGLKRKLRPAIAELERKGYLEPLSEAERFQKVCSGQWRVVFGKAKGDPTTATTDAVVADTNALITALTERGVAPSTARETVARYPLEQIRAQLAVFEWLRTRNDPRMSRNPPGFLLSAIKGDYAAPRDYLKHAPQTGPKRETAQRFCTRTGRAQKPNAEPEHREHQRDGRVRRFWASLDGAGRTRREAEALARATRLQRQWLQRGGSAADATRQALLEAYALDALAHER